MQEREQVREQVLGLEQEREQVLEREQVPVLELVLAQVLGLRIQRLPVRLTGPLSLPEKIIFYSI